MVHHSSMPFDFLWVGGLGKIAKVDISEPLYPDIRNIDYSALALENHLSLL